MTESFIHTRRLADYLEMATMGPGEFKRAVEHKVPRQLTYADWDGKIVNARELLQSEGLATTNLIPTEVYATLIEGSEPAKCMRNVLPIYRMPGPVMTIPYGETGTYASIVAEGAEVPIQTETISVGTLTAVKYGSRPMITREMVADAKWDVIASEIRKAGTKIENGLNREALSVVLEASGTATDSGGSGATPLLMLGKCVGGLIGLGYQPTDIVFQPVAYGATMGAFTAPASDFADSVVRSGSLNGLYGCRTHVCGIADSSSTYTWGWGTDDYIGAVVLDRNAAGAIGIREDIGVEQYSDPVRDLVGMKVTARWDAIALQAYAAYRLQY